MKLSEGTLEGIFGGPIEISEGQRRAKNFFGGYIEKNRRRVWKTLPTVKIYGLIQKKFLGGPKRFSEGTFLHIWRASSSGGHFGGHLEGPPTSEGTLATMAQKIFYDKSLQ